MLHFVFFFLYVEIINYIIAFQAMPCQPLNGIEWNGSIEFHWNEQIERALRELKHF